MVFCACATFSRARILQKWFRMQFPFIIHSIKPIKILIDRFSSKEVYAIHTITIYEMVVWTEKGEIHLCSSSLTRQREKREKNKAILLVSSARSETWRKTKREWNTHTHSLTHRVVKRKKQGLQVTITKQVIYIHCCVCSGTICVSLISVCSRMRFMFVQLCLLGVEISSSWSCSRLCSLLICASHNLSCQLSPILTLMVHVVYMDIFKMIFVGFFSSLLMLLLVLKTKCS